MSFASETSVKAVRKRHVCDGCGRYIDAGSPATRWAGLTDGDFGTAIYHPICRTAETAYNIDVLDWSYGDDWYPLTEIDDESRPWLCETYPEIARRMGIMPPAESGAGVRAISEQRNLPPDDPMSFREVETGET